LIEPGAKLRIRLVLRKFAGYEVEGTLFESDSTVVYLALRIRDRLPVLLKVLGPGRQRPEDSERLTHEYRIMATLETAAVVRPLTLERVEGQPVLVLERFAGVSLDRLPDAPLGPGRFLRLAIAVAGALGEVHARGVIHKDIKPTNILFDEGRDLAKITDFGISSRAPREEAPVAWPAQIEGTLAYMAPEQTGRMNRSVDRRADLYSLGVTFYQLVTGRLPFLAGDAAELVHSHIARAPQPPGEVVPQLPGAISGIIMKLLAKAPEARYQSAEGLKADLERCLAQWRAESRVDSFLLGERDVSDRLEVPQALYGREADLTQLREAWRRVAETGATEVVLVRGPAGVGKSSLVRELQRSLAADGALFLAGKFDLYGRDRPYAAIAEALRGVVLDVLTESDDAISAWRARVQAAVGPYGQIIVDLVPQAELVLGKQPPLVELPPAQGGVRLLGAVRRFLGAFVADGRPLVLFLDDLQWADAQSLALMADLAGGPETRHLLVMGAYRPTEVAPSHPLVAALEQLRAVGVAITELELGPLGPGELATLVADAFPSGIADGAALAGLLHEKTGGNAFFVGQFLTQLHRDRLIQLDRASQRWRWDQREIEARAYTDNVVELMVAKLDQLPASAREALILAACVGGSVDAATLAELAGRSEADIEHDLLQGARERLLLLRGRSSQFLHDGVRQAAYSLVPEEKRAELHLAIARVLLAKTSPDALGERIFEVANHFILGGSKIAGREERRAVAHLLLRAAERARVVTAFATAARLAGAAATFLDEASWQEDHELVFAISLERARSEWMSGDFAEAARLLAALEDRARTKLETLAVHGVKVKLWVNRSQFPEAIESGLEALAIVGIALPRQPSAAQVRQAYERVWEVLGARPVEELAVALPRMSNGEMAAAMVVAAGFMYAAGMQDQNLGAVLTCAMVEASLRHGNTDSSCHAYAYFGSLCVAFGRPQDGYRFGQLADHLVERDANDAFRGQVAVALCYSLGIWVKPYREMAERLDRSTRTISEIGQIAYGTHCATCALSLRFTAGEPLPAVCRQAEERLEVIRGLHQHHLADILVLIRQCVQAQRGVTAELTSLTDETFDEAAFLACPQVPLILGLFHARKLQACATAGDWAQAAAQGALAKEILGINPWMLTGPEVYTFYALALAQQFPGAAAQRQRELAAILAEHEQKLRQYASWCPANFAGKHALVAAEIARIEGRDPEAMELYRRAIVTAREGGLVQIEALAHEIAAGFYEARGFAEAADVHLREARSAYRRWGAEGKVRQLERLHPGLRAGEGGSSDRVFSRDEQIDLLSVIKASQAVSNEVALDRVSGTLMRTVLEQSGAEQGALVLPRDGALLIEAQGLIEKDVTRVRTLQDLPVASSEHVPSAILQYVWRTRKALVLDEARAERRFAGDPYVRRHQPRSVICLPLLSQADIVGLVYLENNALPGAFTPARLTVLEVLAAQAAISLEKARYVQREQAGRAAAEQTGARWALLAQAGELLSESLDYHAVLARLARLAVQSIADWCVVNLVEDGQIQPLAAAHADAAKEPLLAQLRERYPAGWGSPQISARVIETAEPILQPVITDEVLRDHVVDDEHHRILVELGVRSGMMVPLVAHGLVLGTISLCSGRPERRYSETDLALVLELARRAALAIENSQLYQKAQQSIAMRDDFLTVASHELNTPIAALLLNVQAFTTGPANALGPEELRQIATMMERQVQRLTRLVSDLLDVSRMERGLALDIDDVELGAVAQAVVARFEPELLRARCKVRIQGGGARSPVCGRWDHRRIEQVIVNLLTNAVRFGRGAPIEIAIAQSGDTARLSVTDHGIGIEPAQSRRIFERFARAVSISHYGGLGLGLFICRRIVEAHGGSITVESKPGKGATFVLALPLAASPK
jgi:predicted ATPase/signal transduction histidine kinase